MNTILKQVASVMYHAAYLLTRRGFTFLKEHYFITLILQTVRLCITFLFTNIAVHVFTLSKSTTWKVIWLTIFHLFNMVKQLLWKATTSRKLCLFESKGLTFLPPVHVIYVDWQHQYLHLPCHHLLQGVHLTRLSKNTKNMWCYLL